MASSTVGTPNLTITESVSPYTTCCVCVCVVCVSIYPRACRCVCVCVCVCVRARYIMQTYIPSLTSALAG